MTARIMPLGDSITWGANADSILDLSGYRRPLWERMAAAGWDVDFVGSLVAGPVGTWDRDHEGHGGYRADEIEAGFAGWYAAARPGIVLLLIGVNDILQAQAASLPGRWASLLATIHATAPTVRVFMSPLTPAVTTTAFPVPTLAADVAAANALLPGIVATAQSAGARVHLVHVGDVVTMPTGISSDGVHPSASGYDQMAAAWFAAVAPYIATSPPTHTPLPTALGAEVYVSLDGSGDFTGPDDRLLRAVRSIALDEGRDGAQQLNPPKVQAGDVELRNDDGRFSADRADSAYYQRLRPGVPVSFVARHGDSRTYRSHVRYRDHLYYRGQGVWTLGRHIVDGLEQTTDIGQRQVAMSTLGWEALLTRAPVTIPLMTAPLVSECFTAYLDAVGWPADKRDIAVSDTRLLYYWADERDPWSGMLELLASEGPGAFGVRRDGTFYFEDRNYRALAARSSTSQATFYDRIIGRRTGYREHVGYRAHRLYRGRLVGLTHSSFRPASAFTSIYNRATYTTRRRVTGTIAKVYEYGASLVLAANQSRALFIRPSDPFVNAVSPVAATDYVVSAGSATVALTYAGGFLAIVTVTAGAGGATVDGVTSTGLQLRAQPLTVLSETTVQNTVDASASIAKYSPIPGQAIPLTYQVQGWPEIDPAQAEAVCDAWVLRYQEPRPHVTFALKNGDGAHLEQILRRRESDRITLVHAQSGIRADFWINASKLTIADAGGRTVAMEIGAELCDSITGAVWDVSSWDSPDAVWGV